MESVFLDFKTTKNGKLGSHLENMAKFRNRRTQARRVKLRQFDCDNGVIHSAQILKNQKNQIFFSSSLWNVVAMFYLSLALTVQNMISI